MALLNILDDWPIAAFPEFVLDHTGQRTSRTRGGSPVVVDLGSPLWKLSITGHALNPSEALALSAKIDELEGSLFAFKGYDLRRTWPKEYPNGNWPTDIGGVGSSFVGVGRITAVSADRTEVTIDQLPASFKLRAGDYISIDMQNNDTRGLHRVLADKTATALGVAAGLKVRPRVRVNWPLNANVELKKPFTKMFMRYETLSDQPTGSRFHAHSFQAIEAIT